MNITDLDKIINLAAINTEKGARVLAKVFYRTLRKKGFSVNQIIGISTNILGCLIESLNGCEKKMDNDREIVDTISHKDETLPRTYTKYGNSYLDTDNEQYITNSSIY